MNTATPPMPSRAIVACVPAGGAAPAAGVLFPLSVALAAVPVAVPFAVDVASASSPAISVDTADSSVDAAVVACAQILGASSFTALRSLLLQLLLPNKMHAPSCAASAEAPLPVALRQTHVRSVAAQPRSVEARARQARAQGGTSAIRSGSVVAVVGGVAVVVVGINDAAGNDTVCNDVEAVDANEAKRDSNIEGLIMRKLCVRLLWERCNEADKPISSRDRRCINQTRCKSTR